MAKRKGAAVLPPSQPSAGFDPADLCGLCGRPFGDVRIEYHHLVPKELGGKGTVPIHKVCHQKIHATFTNRELLHVYNTFQSLLSHEEIQKFVSWIKRKPSDFYDKNQQTSARRRKNK